MNSQLWKTTPTIFLLLILSIVTARVHGQSPRIHWSDEGDRCWFHTDDDGTRSFFVVDLSERSKTLAFDNEKLAHSLSKTLDADISAEDLGVDRIRLLEDGRQLLLSRRGESWRLDLRTYEITPEDWPAPKRQDDRLFLPPRRSGPSNDSINITITNRLDASIEMVWISRGLRERSYGTIEPGQTLQQHTYTGHVWLIKSATDEHLGCFEAIPNEHRVIDKHAVANVQERETRETRRWEERGRINRSPDGKWTAFVRDHNLWVKSDDAEQQLSFDGTQEESYSPPEGTSPDVRWSEDSETLLAFRTKVVPERSVYLIDSSPSDQLQPRLESYSYRKPGDELPTKTVRLFSLSNMTEIPISHEHFDNPWRLRFRGWANTGDRFFLHYNERGHQTIRLLEVTVADGRVRTLIEETSETFLHYSDAGKSVYEELNDDDILWASERTGWNHLYRYSRSTGAVRNAVTAGSWNVKRIESIDPDLQHIWFYAVGLHPDQDPYHEHFCRVNFDGSGLTILTDGDGTHSIRFERNRRYFVDTWSRVDLAPISELRDSITGERICELDREDTSRRFGNRRLTERFVAKGRDGQTDIWGIIHWPRDFDPTRKYPVVENIYAGPHDHHVPKAFRTRYRHQHQIADAGMIVVQIDGMGTAWRSKAFHDVCYKNLRDAGFPDRIAWLRAAAEKYPQMDLTRVGIYGGSAGGQNAMAALLWHNDFYRVAVADCGCHDNRMDKIWWNEQWMGWPVDDSYALNSNTENAHLLEGDLMLIVGELDRNVDPASTTQVVRQLIQHNKDFEFVLVAGAGHGAAETPWASRKRLNFLKERLSAN